MPQYEIGPPGLTLVVYDENAQRAVALEIEKKNQLTESCLALALLRLQFTKDEELPNIWGSPEKVLMTVATRDGGWGHESENDKN